MLNVSEINPSELPFVCLKDKKHLPGVPGLYFVTDNSSRVRYVGISRNLKVRWSVHHKLKDFDTLEDVKISFIEVGKISALNTLEIEAIAKFRPDLNKTKGEMRSCVRAFADCPSCGSESYGNGYTALGTQRYRCLNSACDVRSFVLSGNPVGRPVGSTKSIGSCPNCGSTRTKKTGKTRGKQRYKCDDCSKTFGDIA